jgi:hypothetical protein
VSIAFAAAVYLAVAPSQGLFYDDWNFIEDDLSHVWEAHVGHLSVVPQVLFLGIRGAFGIEHFLPWALPVIALHLLLAHLLWRIARKALAEAWIATGLVAIFLFFGAGGENILWAFQAGFIGAMAAAVGALVLVDREDIGSGRLVAAATLLVLGVGSSGTALPIVLAVGVVALVRHGWWRTLIVLAPATLAYGTWYLLIGAAGAPETGRPVGLAAILADVPRFALAMLTEGLGSVLPVAIVGTLAATALWIWFFVTVPSARGVRLAPYALAASALVFAVLTAQSRAGFGLTTATSSRYVFFAFAVTLPLIALALTAIAAHGKPWRAAILVTLVISLAYNAALELYWLNMRAGIAEQTYDRIRAAAQLEREFPDRFDPNAQIYSQWAPDLELDDARRFVAEGWLAAGAPSVAARLSVLSHLAIAVTAEEPAADAQCSQFHPGEPPLRTDSTTVVIDADGGTSIMVTLRSEDTVGDARQVTLPGDARITVPDGITVDIASTDRPIAICTAS